MLLLIAKYEQVWLYLPRMIWIFKQPQVVGRVQTIRIPTLRVMNESKSSIEKE